MAPDLEWYEKRCQWYQGELDRLRTALGKISEGRGRFSMDHHQHAANTIEDMKALANAALVTDTEEGG